MVTFDSIGSITVITLNWFAAFNAKSGSGNEDSLQQSLPTKRVSDDGGEGGLNNEVNWKSIHVVDNETSFTGTACVMNL